MTCIIGYIDKKNKVSWIGGDSLGSNGYTKETQLSSKVFRHDVFKDTLMGGTGTFRHLDLLKYSEELFDKSDWYEKTNRDHKFMVTKFIPQVIKLFNEGIVSENQNNKGGNFILATPERLFEIQNDYSVLEPEFGFCSVGCGEAVAMGSLITTKDMDDLSVPDKIIKALEAAEAYSCGVQRPFRLMCSDGREDIIVT